MDGGIVDNELDVDDEFKRDLDSLYILPLRMLPLRSKFFGRGKMIKDSRLDTAIEVFSDVGTGSGRLYLHETSPDAFHDSEIEVREDFAVLIQLGRLESFDVYSLRICLRDLKIEVRSSDYLSLSREKREKLQKRMSVFTQPLLREVYGGVDVTDEETLDIVSMVSDPDVNVTLGRLRGLSELLDIDLNKIPNFLEDFSDIYLSLAYYQQCIDEIGVQIDDFRRDLEALKSNWQLRQDTRFMNVCEALDKTFARFDTSVQDRFDAFYANTDSMWENVTAAKFRKIESVIKAHHTTIGGILCGVGTKMKAWRELFPDSNTGGPVARAEALMTHIVPGMEKITFPLKIIEALDFTFDVDLPK